MPGSSPTPESSSTPGSGPTTEGEEVTCDSVTQDLAAYDSVMTHYRVKGEEPLTVGRAVEFADSFFSSSGERALQVMGDPRKGQKETTAAVEEVLMAS